MMNLCKIGGLSEKAVVDRRPMLYSGTVLAILSLGLGVSCGEAPAECAVVPRGSGKSVIVEKARRSESSYPQSPKFRVENDRGDDSLGFFTGPMPEFGIAVIVDNSTLHVITNPANSPANSVEVCRLDSELSVYEIDIDTKPGTTVVIDSRSDTLVGVIVPVERQLPLIVPVSAIR